MGLKVQALVIKACRGVFSFSFLVFVLFVLVIPGGPEGAMVTVPQLRLQISELFSSVGENKKLFCAIWSWILSGLIWHFLSLDTCGFTFSGGSGYIPLCYDVTLLLAVEAEFALCDLTCWHDTDTQGSIDQSSFNFQALYICYLHCSGGTSAESK